MYSPETAKLFVCQGLLRRLFFRPKVFPSFLSESIRPPNILQNVFHLLSPFCTGFSIGVIDRRVSVPSTGPMLSSTAILFHRPHRQAKSPRSSFGPEARMELVPT